MTERATTLRDERGLMSWALIILVFSFVLITIFTTTVIANVKRTGATNSDIAITQRTDAAVADAIAKLGAGESLPATRSIAVRTFFFALASESNVSNSASAMAASTVPAQVRKSLAVISRPVISLR